MPFIFLKIVHNLRVLNRNFILGIHKLKNIIRSKCPFPSSETVCNTVILQYRMQVCIHVGNIYYYIFLWDMNELYDIQTRSEAHTD